MDPPTYEHQPLHAAHAFRLLRLEGTKQDADAILRGKLHEADLNEPPSYVALSYTWGQPIFCESIEIDGRRLPITENLWLALRSIRRHLGPSDPDLVWTDAICINQADAEERAAQVRQMRLIYENSSLVWPILGPGRPDANLVDKVMDV